MDISAEAFSGIFFILLYVLVGCIVYRWLIPRLSPIAKRLASLMLAAQALVIGVSLFIEPSSSFENWLWQLGHEWNIPTTLASLQLALVGAFALLTAWQVPLPANLAPGRYDVFTGLYRARDRERVPATGANGNSFLDARVPLGSLVIE